MMMTMKMMKKSNGEETREAIGFHEMRDGIRKQEKMMRRMTVITVTSGVKRMRCGWKELIWEAWTVSQRHNHRVGSHKKKGHPEQEEVQVGERIVIRKGERVLKWHDSLKARRSR